MIKIGEAEHDILNLLVDWDYLHLDVWINININVDTFQAKHLHIKKQMEENMECDSIIVN